MKFLNLKTLRTVLIVLFIAGTLFIALSGYLNPIFSYSLDPFIMFEGWVSNRFIAMRSLLFAPTDLQALRERNTELENQVTQLQTRIIELEERLSESQILYTLLDFARTNPQYEYVAATVVGREFSPFIQYIIIDKGSDDGIRHGMPVVTAQGLVGRIDAVIANASRVQLITDAKSTVNIFLVNAETEAQLVGSLTGDVTLEMIPQGETVEPGDLLLTSGLGGNFPPNIFVGQVINIRRLENALFLSATVQPFVDFNNLSGVLVITDFEAVDITPLIP